MKERGRGGKCCGFITCVALLETSLLDKEAQARALGISRACLEKAWKFFGFQKKLHPATAAAVSAGEHFFDEEIMKEHGYVKDKGVSVFAWFALLEDEKKKLLKKKAKAKKQYETYKKTPTGVLNDKEEELMKSQLRNKQQYETDKKTPTGVFNDKEEELMKSQLKNKQRYETDKKTPTGVLNEKGEELMKSQLQYEKKKKRNEEFVRSQRIQPPPRRMNANKCSICPTETSFGWTTAPDALYFVKTLFEKNKLKEYPSIKEANGYLTKKKRRHLKDENVKLRTTDILCYCCWTKCRRAAVARIEELLQAQKKI